MKTKYKKISFYIDDKDPDITTLIGKNANFVFNPNTKNGEELTDFLLGCEEFDIEAEKEKLAAYHTCSEFIKLFEGGDGEKESIDYKSEFENLKSLVLSDSVFWCLRHGIKNPSDFDFEDNRYIELYDWIKANSNQ